MKSIATKISFSVGILILIICVGLGWFAYNRGSSAVMTEVEQALLMQAEEASEIVEKTLGIHLAVLETIAARPEIQGMDWELQQPALLAERDRLEIYGALSVVYPDGSAIHDTGETLNLSGRSYIAEVLKGKPTVSELLVTTDTRELATIFAVPIKKDGEVQGALIARANGRFLKDITDGISFGNSGWAYIFGQDGTLFADINIDNILNQTNIFEDAALNDLGRSVKALGIGNTGIIRFVDRGSAKVSGLAVIPSTGWMIGVGAEEKDVLRNVNQFKNLLVWISIICVVVGALISAIIAKNIARPLQQVQAVVEGVAYGDLTKTVKVKVTDEIGRVANALNETITKVGETMGQVAKTTGELEGTGQQIAAVSQEVSASIEEVASTTNEFSRTLDRMNENAKKMDANIRVISNNALHGQNAIEDIMEQIHALHNKTQNSARNISTLGALSDQIGHIVTVIDNIAEQTNLLALNAAIEAARAGEHGRGFAVVADEVRALAEQSATATTEITSLIKQIQQGVQASVADMDQGAEQATVAVNSVDRSSKILHQILEDVQGIVEVVQEISAGLIQTNTGGHEIASATQEQAASMEEVARSAQILSEMGVQLAQLVRFFKL